MFLPMSCTSPLTVASTILPLPRSSVSSCPSCPSCPSRLAVPAVPLLLLHERLQVRDRRLHRPCALDHLRQEHLSRAEQLADDLHAVHQRPFDDVERPRILPARFLDVGIDEVGDSVDERVRQPLLHRRLPPAEILFPLRAVALDGRRELDQPLGGIGPPVEDHVFDVLEQILRNVLVDDQLSGVDDAHVEAGLDGVIQKGRVHRFADDVVAAERERQVAHAAAHLHARAGRLDDRASPR